MTDEPTIKEDDRLAGGGVERWMFNGDPDPALVGMYPRNDGEYVLYADYANLSAEYDEVAKLLSDARQGVGLLTTRAEMAEEELAALRQRCEQAERLADGYRLSRNAYEEDVVRLQAERDGYRVVLERLRTVTRGDGTTTVFDCVEARDGALVNVAAALAHDAGGRDG